MILDLPPVEIRCEDRPRRWSKPRRADGGGGCSLIGTTLCIEFPVKQDPATKLAEEFGISGRGPGKTLPVLGAYRARYPPSTIKGQPVTNDASSEARKRIALAISSACALRPLGW